MKINERGRIEFEDRDSELRVSFMGAATRDLGVRRYMGALIQEIGEVTEANVQAWANLRKALREQGTGVDPTDEFTYDHLTGQIMILRGGLGLAQAGRNAALEEK